MQLNPFKLKHVTRLENKQTKHSADLLQHIEIHSDLITSSFH